MLAGADELISDLGRILRPDQILAGEAVFRAYECDAYTVDRSFPTVVVLPTSTEEVAAVVRYARETGTPITPRGAGTGLSGGAMPALGGIVVSTKKLTSILEIDVPNRRMLAQAGVANLNLSRAVAADGLHFAPDPSSQSVSTLGGNIAENSGGPHTLKYGVTTQHVLGVTMVDGEGQVRKIGSGVAGGPGYDLLSVVVGSEGTLGIVTEAWIKLTPLPEYVETALASFPSVRAATDVVAEILGRGVVPAAMEMMDRRILEAVRAAFGFDFPEGMEAMLLIECDGTPSATRAEMEVVREIALRAGALACDVTSEPEERARLWLARKKGIGALGRIAPTIVTHDGVIPPSRLTEMLDEVYRVADELGLGVANMFHAGDGNLHPIFMFDDREEGKIDAVVEAGERVLAKCLELGGSVTGEHGVGVEKADLLGKMFSPESLRLQADVRDAFPGTQTVNPCKVLPNQKGCVEHRTRWRGVAT